MTQQALSARYLRKSFSSAHSTQSGALAKKPYKVSLSECKRRRYIVPLGRIVASVWRWQTGTAAAIHRVLADPWMVLWKYSADVYLRVRRAVMVEGMSIREASRVFGLQRDIVSKMLAHFPAAPLAQLLGAIGRCFGAS